MVGLIEEYKSSFGMKWTTSGDSIWLLGVPFDLFEEGDSRVSLSGSSYLEVIHGLVAGRPPEIHLDYESSIQSFLRHVINCGIVESAHDCQ